MAHKITTTWQEALKSVEGATIKVQPQLQSPGVLLIALELPNEEPRILRIEAKPGVALNGDLLAVKAGFAIDLLVPDTDAEANLSM